MSTPDMDNPSESPASPDSGALGPSPGIDQIKASIEACRRQRKDLLTSWREAVAFRVQKPFAAGETSEDRVAVPEDWARTRQKVAGLVFRVPKVIAMPRSAQAEIMAPVAASAVNFKFQHETGAMFALDEALNDLVNAAGIGVVLVRYEERTVTKSVPSRDMSTLPPELQQMLFQTQQVEMTDVQEVVYRGYKTDRISPGSFLWPVDFTQSDWDKAPWLGYDSFLSLVEAKRAYPALGDDFKATGSKPDLLSEDVREGQNTRMLESSESVRVTTIFSRADYYDADAKVGQINQLVFVDGHKEPVEDGPLPWQEYVEAAPDPQDPTGQKRIPGHWVGVEINPIRVCTLGYVSDMAIPPSDTEAGRPQVREMMKSRSQMLRQRDHSIPVRWYDVNRMDTLVADSLRDGTWQGMIPTNGPGDRMIGEVATAQFPRENMGFMNMLTSALDRSWSLSNPQLGTMQGGDATATEQKQAQSASDVVLDYQRSRVLVWWSSIAAVLFGLMQRYADDEEFVEVVGADGLKRLQGWNRHTLPYKYLFDIVPDSGQRVDIKERQESVLRMFNLIGKEPTVNRAELVKEIIQVHGYDPLKLSQQPNPPVKEPANISYRFGGADLLNPIAIAMMMETGVVITPDMITAAKKMIADAITTTPPTPLEGPAAVAPGGQPEPEPPATPSPIMKRTITGEHMV